MDIQISDHFTYKKLLRFTLPSIGMMVFTSIYSVVDGYFVSNYAGSSAFAAINLILPFLMIFSAIGFMIGTGGTALVSMKLGQGDNKKANAIFSMLVYLVIAIGIVVTIVGEYWLEDVSLLLGATEDMLPYCIAYGRIYLLAMTFFMLQTLFQSFLVAAGNPKLGFRVTVAAGLTNMVLDYLLVGVLPLGVKGAALATALSQFVGGIIPLVYFISKNNSLLRLGKAEIDFYDLRKTCTNGASEFLTQISFNVVAMVYNLQLLKYIGEDGVTAFGVIMYVCFIFIAVFIGYSIGVAPLVGFNYGADNKEELKSLFRKSIYLIGIMSIVMLVLSEIFARPLAIIYVGYSETLMSLTERAFRIYAISFALTGFNAFGSAFFTALNNGKVSATISVFRTLVFQIIAVLVLPLIVGVDGLWEANILAEALSFALTVYFLLKKKKHYGY